MPGRTRPGPKAAKDTGTRAERVGAHAAVIPSAATTPSPVGAATVSAAFAPVSATNTEAELLAPNVIGVKHWSRLLGGLLHAFSPRMDWANLLRRSFDVDVLSCPKCRGRLRVLGEVTDPAMVGLVLGSLWLPTEAPRVARARDPTELWAPDEG